jgi:RNA polymerase sigma factor (sigma-70 family)
MPSPSTVLLRTQTDERLVALARAGHDRAFEAIVERYRRQLLRACRRILPEARAEDALQQALMAAWAGLRRGDDVHELRPWLFRIVRNTALNQLRVAGYDLDELVETLGSADDPEDEVVRRAVVRQTLAAVAALPDRQREALLRTAIEGQAQADVARDLGLSSTAMRQLVHRARVAVRTAATAVVPMPVAAWFASAGGATLAKAGTVAVLVGAGAATAPVVIEHRAPHRADASAEANRGAPRPAKTASPAASASVATAAPVLAAAREDSDRVAAPPEDRARARSRRRDGGETAQGDEDRGGENERGDGEQSGRRGGDESHEGRDDGGHSGDDDGGNSGDDDGGSHDGRDDGVSGGDDSISGGSSGDDEHEDDLGSGAISGGGESRETLGGDDGEGTSGGDGSGEISGDSHSGDDEPDD